MNDNSRLVYSTDGGDFRKASPPPTGKRLPPKPPSKGPALPADGVVRIFREKGGRGGKEVTVVRGLALGEPALKDLASELKRLCGVGGTVRGSEVELQGDQRERVRDLLLAKGMKVKLAGG